MESPEHDLSVFIRTHVALEHQAELHRLVKNVIHDARNTLLAEEHDRIIAMLNNIKSDMGDLDSVSGYGVHESIDEIIASMQV